jgi:flagellar biosynthesis protein FlhG
MSNNYHDQAENLRKHFQDAETKIITISGGKGGVGKSVFSVNISSELALRKNKVLLFDSDAGFANASILLGKTVKKTLSDYIDGKISIEDCVHETDSGVNVISTGFDFKDWKLFQNNFNGTMAQEFLALARKHDYVIIDTGAGYSDKLIHFYLASDKIFLVTVPEPTAIVNAYTLIKALSMLDVDSELDVILNMITDKSEIRSVEEVLRKTVKNFLNKDINNFYKFVHEKSIHESVKRQIPIVRYKENNAFSKNLKILVDDITNNKRTKKLSFTERFKKIIGIEVR